MRLLAAGGASGLRDLAAEIQRSMSRYPGSEHRETVPGHRCLMLEQITDELIASLDGMTFGPPVTHVYNPLVYARAAWDAYCARYGQGEREVLLVGMNPGPCGLHEANEARTTKC